MSQYEEEHNIPKESTGQTEQSHRLPDLSTFFSQVDHTSTQNTNTLPLASDVAISFRLLANAFQVHRGELEGVAGPTQGVNFESNNELLQGLIDELMRNADNPPKELDGVPESFLAELERVPKKNLKEDQSCPICSNLFLDDKYPLVVRLPCHASHMFDLECITPWLKLKSTCPLDRQDLLKKKEPPKPPPQEDNEEEWDDMYA